MQKENSAVIPAPLHEKNTPPQLETACALIPHSAPLKQVNAYAELKKLIKHDNLLDKQPVYYTYKFVTTLALLTLSITLLLTIHHFWFQLLNAVLFALASTQLGFLGHDAGHRQIFHSTRKNTVLTLITGNLLIGMSNGWWLDKHNRHHSHPNETDMDPDIDLGVLAFTEEDARKTRGLLRVLVKHQKYFFFPLLALLGIDLQQRSIVHLLKNREKQRVLEITLLIVHHILYLSLLFFCLNPWQALIFLVIHQALFGIFLGSAFAPNHKGMPVLTKGHQIDFLHRQVLTSRNVHSGFFNDFWYGGLNYQIEHHLFPSMPRNNLKKAQKIVKTYCQEQEIAYYETGIVQSFREILHYLHEISAPLRIREHNAGKRLPKIRVLLGKLL